MRRIFKTIGLALLFTSTSLSGALAQDVLDARPEVNLSAELPPSLQSQAEQDRSADPVEGLTITQQTMARALRASMLEDWDNALTYAQTSAAGGSAEGALLAGHILLHGLSSQGQNDEMAVRWLKRAGDRGDADALVILSRLAGQERGGLTAFEAYDFLNRAAESGDTRAAHELGLYLIDRGDPGAANEALDWLRMASQSGRVAAYNDYAYALGDWVHGPHDLTEARTWYERSGIQGDAYGALMAGAMHLAGDGEDASGTDGTGWIRRAAELGHPAAMGEYALMLYQGAPGLAANPFEAAQWARNGALAGDQSAQYLYAYALATGDGTTRDLEQSYVWTLRAAQPGPASLVHDPDRITLQTALERVISPERQQALAIDAALAANPLGG